MQSGTSGCSGQWHESVNFGGLEVKGQGYTRPKIDLDAWWRYILAGTAWFIGSLELV